MAMFEAKQAKQEKVKELITVCETRRDILEAPAWKEYSSYSAGLRVRRADRTKA